MLTDLPPPQTQGHPVARLFPRAAAKPSVAFAGVAARDLEAPAEAGAMPDRRPATAFVFHSHTVRFEFTSLSLVLTGLPAVQDGREELQAPLEVTRCRLTRQDPMTRPTLQLWLRGATSALFGAAPVGESADRAGVCDPRLQKDAGLERLLRTLTVGQDAEAELGATCANAVGLAIVSRIATLLAEAEDHAPRRVKSALPKWRLKRVTEFVDAHLAETITLADLAEAAGLTRMHFAAQFRVATGVRPHEYLLRRRIARAQELLAVPGASLVDVALSVGFQTQAHFTTVFKRFTGQTPHRWRCAHDLEVCT
ncbi:AraC family transcriptional regulator [Azorhizobium sp. AG788]|uniref:helix-turn-helix transcriptional regulator n=1 Tax=Azorhizobium sp. AG788 TaxID=2183897 RepID=UPI003138E323